jgi:hypothetical protein
MNLLVKSDVNESSLNNDVFVRWKRTRPLNRRFVGYLGGRVGNRRLQHYLPRHRRAYPTLFASQAFIASVWSRV